MQQARDVLTPDTLSMLATIGQSGSFAAAARALGLVPSTLTYRVRQVEETLDVLLFDRSSRQARLTEAGQELLREGERLLQDIDAVAHRVKRVATGWEPQFTLACDSLIARNTVMDLCERFFALQTPTRLKILDETLSGTWLALSSGHADLALGGSMALEPGGSEGIQSRLLGQVPFVYAVAPHHPLSAQPEPLKDAQIRRHRAVAVADSAMQGAGRSFGLLSGQEVFSVASMEAKLEAQIRGLGVGFLPQCLAAPYLEAGHLVAKRVERSGRVAPVTVGYAWRAGSAAQQGRALRWWLEQLDHPATRNALLAQRA